MKEPRMRAQVMIDLKPLDAEPPRQTTEAAVVLDDPVTAYWPLDMIYEAMRHYCDHRRRDDIPQIYPVNYDSRVIGYMVRAVGATEEEREQLFWEILRDSGHVVSETDSGFEYDTGEALFVEGWENFASDLRIPVGIVAYVQPEESFLFPHELVNDALRLLMGQSSWPRTLPLYPHPGRKGAGAPLKGLWIAPPQDDLNYADHAYVDDKRIKAIIASNSWRARRRHPEWCLEDYEV
jgi:hypothetical protein